MRIEGAFYIGIGLAVFVIWSVSGIRQTGNECGTYNFSLGTRVALAYVLSAIPAIGVTGIWWSVPIGMGIGRYCGIDVLQNNKKERM